MPISVFPKLYTARGTRHQMTYLFVYLATKLHPDCASWLGVRLRVRPGGRGRVDTWGSRLRRLCFACSSPLLMDDFPLSPEELAIFLRSTPLLHDPPATYLDAAPQIQSSSFDHATKIQSSSSAKWRTWPTAVKMLWKNSGRFLGKAKTPK